MLAEMSGDIQVLYVDDHAALRDLTAEFLEKANPSITVVVESDPNSVPERVADEDIDCVVSDYEMPECDGLELCERIRAEHEHLPYFLFTNRGDRESIEGALDAGVTDFIEKASGIEHYKLLANRITNAVQHHRDRQRLLDFDPVN